MKKKRKSKYGSTEQRLCFGSCALCGIDFFKKRTGMQSFFYFHHRL